MSDFRPLRRECPLRVIHDRVELEAIPAMSAIAPKAEVNLEY
jgi:hypothetical protein